MEIPNEAMAVISTAHVHQFDAALIEPLIQEGKITGMTREHGWLVHTNPLRHEAAQALPSLNYLVGFLAGKGSSWILFDQDADTIEGLQTYDW